MLRIRLTRIEALTEARQDLRNESNAYSALIYALQYADLNQSTTIQECLPQGDYTGMARWNVIRSRARLGN
jgi:hypothetical protein